MKVAPRQSLDRILECAVIDSWAALMRAAESSLIHIDYAFGPRDFIEYLKLWIARGHWFLACEYWMSASRFHTSGIHFENSANDEHNQGVVPPSAYDETLIRPQGARPLHVLRA